MRTRTPAPPTILRVRRRRRRGAALALLLGGLALLPGCVERALLIRSDPPGARVFVDGEDVGTTPARVPFDFYGTREVMVRMEETSLRGERSLGPETRLVKVRAPWYQWFPFDLASQFLWPGTIVDEHVVEFTLEPRDYDTWRANYEEGARARGIRFPTDPDPEAETETEGAAEETAEPTDGGTDDAEVDDDSANEDGSAERRE